MNHILDKFQSIQFDKEKYDYKALESCGQKDFYKGSDEEIIAQHIQHLMFDYQEEGWWMTACCGRIEGDIVFGDFIFCRRKKD